MKNYVTIFGEKISGEIINDSYDNILLVNDKYGVTYVVHKADVYNGIHQNQLNFNLEECKKLGRIS